MRRAIAVRRGTPACACPDEHHVLRCHYLVSRRQTVACFIAVFQFVSNSCFVAVSRSLGLVSLPRFTPLVSCRRTVARFVAVPSSLSLVSHLLTPTHLLIACFVAVRRSLSLVSNFTPTHLSVACFVAVSRSLSLVSHLPACRSWAPLPSPGLSPSFHTYPPVGRVLRYRSQVSLPRFTPTHVSHLLTCRPSSDGNRRRQRLSPSPPPPPPSSLPTLPTSSPRHSWRSSGR